ncbi:putative Tetratricopeptide TPR 2 repeat protein [Magnetofaba australis IT-1]|uniref:Putative Tetratricopeptide TPR 2 repeat protein n=1 Tax=Magnetofaba australis IT-1 TaxID=1434232 RepID=A0A1Y2K8B0_9PROT|nr:putative Tetratricopeptide TPR 2 repeat protein [Magnetofaba australis IT-1]
MDSAQSVDWHEQSWGINSRSAIQTQDYDAALANLTRKRDALRQQMGQDHPLLTPILEAMAEIQSARNEDEAALALRERLTGMVRRTLGPNHPAFALALEKQADVLWKMQRLEHAEVIYGMALAIFMKQPGPYHRSRVRLHMKVADTLIGRKQYGKAMDKLRVAMSMAENVLGGANPELSPILGRMAQALQSSGDAQAAHEVLLRAEQIAQHTPVQVKGDSPAYLISKADYQFEAQQFKAAQSLYEKALNLSSPEKTPPHITAYLQERIAATLAAQFKWRAAERVQRQATQTWVLLVGAGDPATQQAQATHADYVRVLHDLAPQQPALLKLRPTIQLTQKRLAAIGIDPGPVDGIPGPKTLQALHTFTQRMGLPPTGKLTLTSLAAPLAHLPPVGKRR